MKIITRLRQWRFLALVPVLTVLIMGNIMGNGLVKNIQASEAVLSAAGPCCRTCQETEESVSCPVAHDVDVIVEEHKEGCGLSAVCKEPDDCANCYDPECQCCYDEGYPCYWNYNKYPWY